MGPGGFGQEIATVPGERNLVLAPIHDVSRDGVFEIADTGEAIERDGVLRAVPRESLDHVQPQGASQFAVHGEAQVLDQSPPHVGVLVGSGDSTFPTIPYMDIG